MDGKSAALAEAKRLAEKKIATAKAVQGRRLARKVRQTPSVPLFAEWKAAMERDLPDAPVVAWGAAEATLAGKLVREHGFDVAVDLVRHFIKTWRARWASKDGNPPSMMLCWSMRARLLAEVTGGARAPKTKRERISTDEFNLDGEEDRDGDLGW